jgi:hypothetical protein
MIDGKFFEGDEDISIRSRQHDVYDQALTIIVESCVRKTSFARQLFGDEYRTESRSEYKLDHRTLQMAHDLLAAAWRSKNDVRQQMLALEPRNGVADTDIGLWLNWLRSEMTSWMDHPHLVRSVMTILANQNQPSGYQAEALLSLNLVQKFNDVPWKRELVDAIKRDLSEST